MKKFTNFLPVNIANELNEFLEKEKVLVFGLILLFSSFFIFPFVYHGSIKTGLQILIIGAVLSSLYAVLAVGFSLIYGVAKMFKLSLGGYYVLGAYTMLFLLETMKIRTSGSLLESLEGIILLGLIFLPVIVSFALLYYFWHKYNMVSVILLLIFAILAAGGVIVWIDGVAQTLYTGFSTLLIAAAISYLEFPKRVVIISTLFFSILLVIMSILGMPSVYIALMVIAVMVTAGIAMLVDRHLLDQVRSSHVNTMIVTFSMALLIQSLIQVMVFPEGGKILISFGPEDRGLLSIVPKASVNIFGALIDNIRIISLLASVLACLALYAFIWFSRMGMSLRAVAQDEEAAALAGINIRKMTALVSGIGMGLIAFAAVLTSAFSARPLWNPFMGWSVLIIAISVVTLGGMGSLPGSFIAAFIIGYIEVIVSSIPHIANFSVVIPFACIILVLIFKPEGLFGTKKELEG